MGPRSIKILTQEDLIAAGCFDMRAAVSIAEKSLIEYSKGNILFPDKVSMVFDQATQNRINCLPAGIKNERIYGMKWVSVFPENPHKRNLPNLTASILLSDMETGFPLAFMEGTMCSNMRTAAVSSVAAKYLSVNNPKTVGFIGCGEQAKSHFVGLKTVFPSLERCFASSRTEKSVIIFIEQMRKFEPEMRFIDCSNNYENAVKEADIIVTAISGQEKILRAEWIKDGAFYCHVGGLEDEFDVALKADKIVCDDWSAVKHRTQTISQMYQKGLLKDNSVYADLYEIVAGQKLGREKRDSFVYYNGVGLSYVDVALAYWMYRKTEEKKIGTRVVMQNKSMFER